MCCLKTKQNKRMMHDLICVGMPVNSLRIATFEMLFKIMKINENSIVFSKCTRNIDKKTMEYIENS